MNNNILTIKQLKSILIAIVFLLIMFIAPFNETLLTINEELFVIVSFFIFVDLFGNTIMTAISEMTDARIKFITQKLSVLLLQKFTGLTELYTSLISLTNLVLFRNKLLYKFRLNFNKIVLNRTNDLLYLISHINYVIYKTSINNEFFNYKLISNFAAEKAGIKLTNVLVTEIMSKAKQKREENKTTISNKRKQPVSKIIKKSLLNSIFKKNVAVQFKKLQTVAILLNKKTVL
jgi:hypothetical protein